MTLRPWHGVPTVHTSPINDDSSFVATTAFAAVGRWLQSDARLLVLAGSVGTGKSLAAAWATAEFLRSTAERDPWGKPRRVDDRLWISAPHLSRFSSWDEELTKLEAAPFLVVDDIGEEERTPKTGAIIQSMISTRDANALPTIITTNLDGETFQARYGKRIIDRLRQSGVADDHATWWIRCTEKSLRGRVTPKPGSELPKDDEQPETVHVVAEQLDKPDYAKILEEMKDAAVKEHTREN